MISCEKLSAGYGRKTVISGISWKAAEGKLTVLVGPNGCGKSTLLKSLTGTARIKDGAVYLEGKALPEWNSRELAKRVAYLPQSRSDANISAYRMVLHGRFPYLDYPRHYSGEDKKRVEAALKKMGISHLSGKPVSELSGGEKQKVYLAMALVQEAPVLLLDEPATYLDLPGQLELLQRLKELSGEGKTVVLVLHDLNHALQYADEMLVMEAGRIVRVGTPEDIVGCGILEKVFRLKVHELADENGRKHYWFCKDEAR